MYQLSFEERFIKKLKEIIDYIALDNYLKAVEIKDFIFDYIKILKHYPLLWKRLANNYRQIVLPKYRYKIVYKINKQDKTILIYSIRREQQKF